MPNTTANTTANTRTNQLFFISASNSDGNLDLFVVAVDETEAESYWREHYELDESDKLEWLGAIPGVTPTRPAGSIDWNDIRKD